MKILQYLKLTSRVSLVLISLLSGSLFSVSLLAQTDDLESLNELKVLVEQKRFNDAFILSNQLLDEWGGEPAFDLLAGRSAYGAGYFQEAVFSFERVLLLEPDIIQARLYLAFSYFQVKNFGAAQTELSKLLKEILKPDDRLRVEDYLAQITKVKKASVSDNIFSARISYAYDSNANSGTTQDNLSSIPLDAPYARIIGNLDDTSLEQEDTFADVALTYGYNQRISQKSALTFNASYINTTYDEQTQFDRELLSLTGVFSDEWFGTNVNVSAFAQPMLLDSEFFRSAYGLSFDSTLLFSDKWSWLWGVSYTAVNINANDNQDLDQYAVRTRLTYQGDAILMLDLSYGDDKNKENNEIAISNARNYWLVSYSYILPIGSKWLLIANSSYQEIKFDGANPFFAVARDEESTSALLSLDYFIAPEWKVTATLTATNKNSNIEIYEYNRSTAMFSITRTF